MNSLNIVFKPQNNIEIKVNDIPEGIEILFKGTIQDINPALYLNSFFNEVHTKMIEKSLQFVELNLTKLSFLNSSGIRCFILWVTQIPKTPEIKRYHLKIKINKEFLWQENSFNLFKSIEPYFISIEKI